MKIVSLLSSATEMLFALGVGEQVAAVSHECDYPPEVSHLPRATRSRIDSSQPSARIDEQVRELTASGGALYEIDRDLLCRLMPDLIVTQAQCNVCAVRYQDVLDLVASEPALAHTQVLALNPSSLADVLSDIQRVAKAVDDAACVVERNDVGSVVNVAHRYVAELQGRVDRVAANNITVRPRVVCLEWLEPLMTAGNWTPELIKMAGGASCLAEPGRHSDYVEWSAVLACDPDVLLIAPCGFNLERSQLEARRLWQLPGFADLAAVKNGRAYVLDGNAYLNRSGPRIVDTLEILASLLRGRLPNDGSAAARLAPRSFA